MIGLVSDFGLAPHDTSTLSVTPQFLEGLLEIASKFVAPSPTTATLKDAHALCGKAGRLAQVVPAVTPFVQQLFAALAGSLLVSQPRPPRSPTTHRGQ